MTAPLLYRSADLKLGRKIKDCEDGLVLTIVGVDGDGDYLVVDQDGKDEGCVWSDNVHEPGEPHQPCIHGVSDPSCIDCYEWLEVA